MITLHISDLSLPEIAIPEHQQINLIAGQHCIYFKVSYPENLIPERHQIDPVAGWYCSYQKDSQPENAIPDNQQIETLAGRHSQCLKVCSLKTEFLNISRSTNYQDSATHI